MASFAIVATVVSAPSPSSASSWFWEEVPSRIEDGSRANARNQRQGIFRTKAQARSVLTRWRSEIKAAAREAGINEALIVAIVVVESGGDPYAKSP